MPRRLFIAIVALGAIAAAFSGGRMLAPEAAAAASPHFLDCVAVKGTISASDCAEANVALAAVEREIAKCTVSVADADAAAGRLISTDVYQALRDGKIPPEAAEALVKQERLAQLQDAVALLAALMAKHNETAKAVISNLRA